MHQLAVCMHKIIYVGDNDNDAQPNFYTLALCQNKKVDWKKKLMPLKNMKCLMQKK